MIALCVVVNKAKTFLNGFDKIPDGLWRRRRFAARTLEVACPRFPAGSDLKVETVRECQGVGVVLMRCCEYVLQSQLIVQYDA